MISLHFGNLRLFIIPYVIATVSSGLIYFYLGRIYPGKEYTLPRLRRARNYGINVFNTPRSYGGNLPLINFILRPASFTDSLQAYWNTNRIFCDMSYYFHSNRFPSGVYEELKTDYTASPIYESTTVYQFYKIMVAVSAWAGILLLITPFSYIYVFLPHFPAPFNIVVAIILAIAIFEGLISTIFFRVGTNYVKVSLVVSMVVIVFTLSLLSPSMSWLSAFSTQGRLDIYLILLVMFGAITALISQLKTKRNLFVSSLVFSAVAYFSFVTIVLYNVIQFL